MTVIFAVVIALAAVSALGVVFSRQTIYSALCLVVTVTMLAVLFLLLNAQFLFAVQLIIYAGAVMVLFVFIVALLSPDAEDRPTLDLRAVIGVLGVVVVTALVFIAARNGITYNTNGFHGAAVGAAQQPVSHVQLSSGCGEQRRQRADGRRPAVHQLPAPVRDHLDAPAGRCDRRRLPDQALQPVTERARMLNPNLFPFLLGLAAFLFTVGAMGVLIRRNPIVVFMCIELMLNAANVALVAYGRFLNSEEGQIFAFMVIVVAAAEVVVGLALITQIFRLGRELDVDDLSEMKE